MHYLDQFLNEQNERQRLSGIITEAHPVPPQPYDDGSKRWHGQGKMEDYELRQILAKYLKSYPEQEVRMKVDYIIKQLASHR